MGQETAIVIFKEKTIRRTELYVVFIVVLRSCVKRTVLQDVFDTNLLVYVAAI